jgi:ABC-2 type transport system ATP-binding protein
VTSARLPAPPAAERPPAIQTHALSRRFGNFVAVDGITFEVRRGQIFGLLGPNGCGKTTTIRMLCGVLPPSSGSAFVLGYDVTCSAEQIKRTIGYMSQRAGVYDDLTPREHLLFYGGLYGLEGRAGHAAVEDYLAASGLAPRADTVAANLPGGLRQRLAFGCATLHRPPLLFLDEPTAGVDPIARRQFWDTIHALAEQGTTIFVTTHFLEDAEYCHVLGLMHRGRLVAFGTPADLKRGTSQALLEVECAAPHEALDVLATTPEVQDVSLFGTVVHVLLRPGLDPGTATGAVHAALTRAGIASTHMAPTLPSLEDVFVAATVAAESGGVARERVSSRKQGTGQ